MSLSLLYRYLIYVAISNIRLCLLIIGPIDRVSYRTFPAAEGVATAAECHGYHRDCDNSQLGLVQAAGECEKPEGHIIVVSASVCLRPDFTNVGSNAKRLNTCAVVDAGVRMVCERISEGIAYIYTSSELQERTTLYCNLAAV